MRERELCLRKGFAGDLNVQVIESGGRNVNNENENEIDSVSGPKQTVPLF